MKRLPEKISPDNLKDTVVDIRFQSEHAQEVLPGLVYQELKERFRLLPRPTMGWQLGPKNKITIEQEGTVQFANENVKLQLIGKQLVFNTLDKYAGWKEYSKCMGEVLGKLFDKGYIKAVQRIGLRYISEYPGISIFEVMNESPAISLSHGEGQNLTYRMEVRREEYTIVLNVADRVARQGAPAEAPFFSLVDIDVFKAFHEPLQNLAEAMDVANKLHQVEKEVFFGILKDEYIASLNPEYKQ